MSRLTFEERRNVIVNAAVRLANEKGLAAVTWRTVADACLFPTSRPTVRSHFRTHTQLRTAIVEHPDASDTVRAAAKDIGIVHDIAS